MNWAKIKKGIWEWWYGTTRSDIRRRVHQLEDVNLRSLLQGSSKDLGGPALYQYKRALFEFQRRGLKRDTIKDSGLKRDTIKGSGLIWAEIKKGIWEWWYGTTKSKIRAKVQYADHMWLYSILLQDRRSLSGAAAYQYDMVVLEANRRHRLENRPRLTSF